METKKLRELKKEELKQRLQDKKKELSALIYDKNSGKIKDVRETSKIRKEIARILTILKEIENNN